MSFVPPRCPYLDCEHHASPPADFYRRRGSYRPRCRSEDVPRFRCRSCNRSFSRQTFRHDFRDRRPDCNERLFELLTSGVGLRQAGRKVGLDIHGVLRKLAKLGRTCRLLHQNLARRLPPDLTYSMDEEETYEGASIRPLTMPVLIEKRTWFVVATGVGPIRRLAPAGTARRRRQERDERRYGRRPDRSRRSVRRVMVELARKAAGPLRLHTDQKSSYGSLARRVFGERVVHETTAGTLARGTFNPLFAINTTLAMTRDNCGRLRRRSWLVSKKAVRLSDQMALFTVYRNYVRRRFNRDDERDTPARLLGLVPRNLRAAEVVRWRQDWGRRSVHPASFSGSRAIADGRCDTADTSISPQI